MQRTALKTTGWVVGGLTACALGLYATALFINRQDREPSAAVKQLEALYRDRPSIADSNNAYIYLQGIEAPLDQDPQVIGLQRVAWLQQWRQGNKTLDPMRTPADHAAIRPPGTREFLEACHVNHHNDCAAAFAASQALSTEWQAAGGWVLERYRALISRPGWLETVPFDAAAPLPSYGIVFDGQALLLFQVRDLAQQGNPVAARDLLQKDHVFWRSVFASSDILLTKMVALAALKRNLKWTNLILRSLPPGTAALVIPDAWRVPISDTERSMLRCTAGEWRFVAATLHMKWASDSIDNLRLTERLGSRLLLPLYQSQDSMNRYAEYYLGVGQRWHVPFDRYEAAVLETEQLAADMEADLLPYTSLYNITGRMILALGFARLESYARRVGDLEGIRRAVLTAATLRTAGLQASAVNSALSAPAAERNPYTGAPLQWDEITMAIVFQGIDIDNGKHGEYRIDY